jgi:hypothetical protein
MSNQKFTSKYEREISFLKVIFFCLFSVLTAAHAVAQTKQVQNIPKYDKQIVHFGFALGFTSPDFRLVPDPDFRTMDSIYNVESEAQLGFLLGIVSNLRLGDYFDLRFVPLLTFAQRNITYTFAPSGNILPTIKKVESTFLEFPLMLKYKSARVNNYRAYVIGGGKYSIDLVSQANVQKSDKQPVRLQPYDYGYEIGFGFDFYLMYFKFAVEIKMYNGINNLLVKDEFIYSRSLETLNSKIFYLSLLFE